MSFPHPSTLPHRARHARLSVKLAWLAVLVASISLVIVPAAHFDPHGWIAWGKEIALGQGSFSTMDYPSWKPLPLLFTLPLAFTGPLAPFLWLVFIRATGLLAMAGTFRLANRLGGPRAGVLSVAALALVPGWWGSVIGGHIEPLLLGFGLLAVERHRAGHVLHAFGLGVLAALGRPEAWFLLAAYGAYLVWEERGRAPVVAGLLLAVPAVWIGGDWIGSGDPFHGGVLASLAADAIHQRRHGSVTTYTLGLAAGLFVLPLWCAAAVGLSDAVRARHRLLLLLVGGATIWIAIDVAMTKHGYPGEIRFMLPAAGMLAIVVGMGAASVLELARRSITPRVAMAIAMAAVPQAVTRAFIHETPPPIAPKLATHPAGDPQTDLLRVGRAQTHRFRRTSRHYLHVRINHQAARTAARSTQSHRAG